MIYQQESTPKSNLGTINKDSLLSLDQWAISSTLIFDPDILAQNKWQEMLIATQKDGLERGLTVAFDGKNIFISKFSIGTKDSISPDFLPRGIKSIFSRREKNLVSLHTHPMPPELNHIQTIPVSDKDINLFINSSFKAMITIDRGGVHMLAKNPYSSFLDPDEETTHKIAEESLKIASEKENTAITVMQEMAKKLKPLGIKYYYSPSLSISTDGLIELNDVLK